ncbi:MAG: DUF2066 domain-containing protein [Alphaproteobacteria bacterium]
MVAALVLDPAAGLAQEMEASYRVRDVEVEATAQDAVAARDRAIEQGQRRALEQLLERLTADGDAPPDVRELPVADLVSSLEVLDETVGPTSYAATLEVAFDRGAVEELLDDRGIAYADLAAEPVVVVPLWETGSGLRLWEPDSAWKAAWDRALEPDGLVPFVVPLGDLQDLALLNPDQAARADRTALTALAERYGTDGVVIARLEGSGEPGAPLEVTARRYGDTAGEPYRAVVRRGSDESLEQSLERAVAEMQAAYDARFRERRAVERAPSERLVVTTAVRDLDDWGRVLRLLDGLAEVERAEVRRFSQAEATLELRVAGGRTRLEESLDRQGWRLSARDDDGWQLERGGADEGSSTL